MVLFTHLITAAFFLGVGCKGAEFMKWRYRGGVERERKKGKKRKKSVSKEKERGSERERDGEKKTELVRRRGERKREKVKEGEFQKGE